MNRLIILGNGFDIAHNLKTRYNDFISDYWEKIQSTNYEDEFLEFTIRNHNIKQYANLKNILNYISSSGGFHIQPRKRNGDLMTHDFKYVIKVYNEFFMRINERFSDVNWVDIEMEYYSNLKQILNCVNDSKGIDDFENKSLSAIIKLNKEIEQITNQFENYLESVVVPKIDDSFNPQIKKLFSNDKEPFKNLEIFYEEFPKRYLKELKSEYRSKIEHNYVQRFDNTCILNFNYTDTVHQYINDERSILVNIHGEIKNDKNPINLGFGDERDKFYSEIEDYNQNEYLKFMKSFYYTNNNNYKKLFDFLEDSYFQVQIMGHSCGLSDRTLLNAIFEHKNCKSIKVFYHKYSEKNSDGESDNYSQIIRNISRHFNQKTMMREKIVNKDYCCPLPQL